MHTGHIHIGDISKIEGHASLSLKIDKGRVAFAQFKGLENQRFFEKIVEGKPFQQVPGIVARICGFCSSAHAITACEAIEKAFNVEISEQALHLRELSINAMFLKSHSLHLVFLALPDFFGVESALEFSGKQAKWIELGLRLKKCGTDMLRAINGMAYHGPRIAPGGYKAYPKQSELDSLARQLDAARDDAIGLIRLFSSFDFSFERKTDYVGLVGKDYSFLVGEVACSRGICIPEESFPRYLEETVVPYSISKKAVFQGRPFMVGALARVNLNGQNLGRNTKKIWKDLKLALPSHSPFANNLAQALEVYQCLDSSVFLLNKLKIRNESLPEIKPRAVVGLGLTEAPRGTLCHEYSFNSKGEALHANIVVPTSQNQANVEEDLKIFVPPLLKKPKEEIQFEIEKLVRAYDPCMSCATHFLKLEMEVK